MQCLDIFRVGPPSQGLGVLDTHIFDYVDIIIRIGVGRGLHHDALCQGEG